MSSFKMCDTLPYPLCGHQVIIDGNTSKNATSYLQSIWEQLEFPAGEKCNWDAYLDWMRDLSWIKSKSISIVVENYDSFLCEEAEGKKMFESDFTDVLFPFWENDANVIFENPNDIKTIDVYCVRKPLVLPELVSTQDTCGVVSTSSVADSRKNR